MRLRTIKEALSADSDINLGALADYKGAKAISKAGDFQLYVCNNKLFSEFILVDGDDVIGEFTLAKDPERDGLYEHTAYISKKHRGKGVYLDALKAIGDHTKKDIYSYPFDPDSEQERSEMNNKFWAKNGEQVDDEDGPIYVLKHDGSINEAMDADYRKWRKANVSYRGSKADSPLDGVNEYDGVMGKGLYTTPLSNKSMAKGYGTMFIMVGAIPKKPLVMRSINDWEIWSQKMMAKVNGDPSGPADQNKFFKNHTIEDEVKKLGYDGVIITGREMVLYDPDKYDIRFFKTEREVESWYEDHKE